MRLSGQLWCLVSVRITTTTRAPTHLQWHYLFGLVNCQLPVYVGLLGTEDHDGKFVLGEEISGCLWVLIIPLGIGTYRTLIIMQIGPVLLLLPLPLLLFLLHSFVSPSALLFRQLLHKIIDALIFVAPSTNLANTTHAFNNWIKTKTKPHKHTHIHTHTQNTHLFSSGESVSFFCKQKTNNNAQPKRLAIPIDD